MGQEQNSLVLSFKLKLEICCTENGQVYLCNTADGKKVNGLQDQNQVERH